MAVGFRGHCPAPTGSWQLPTHNLRASGLCLLHFRAIHLHATVTTWFTVRAPPTLAAVRWDSCNFSSPPALTLPCRIRPAYVHAQSRLHVCAGSRGNKWSQHGGNAPPGDATTLPAPDQVLHEAAAAAPTVLTIWQPIPTDHLQRGLRWQCQMWPDVASKPDVAWRGVACSPTFTPLP